MQNSMKVLSLLFIIFNIDSIFNFYLKFRIFFIKNCRFANRGIHDRKTTDLAFEDFRHLEVHRP